jgi:hypothetical protein
MSQDELYDEYQRRYGQRSRSTNKMPRSYEPPEWKILRWFRTVPLGEANLLLSVVKDILKEREDREGHVASPRHVGADPEGEPVFNRRKRKGKKAEAAEVEQFN